MFSCVRFGECILSLSIVLPFQFFSREASENGSHVPDGRSVEHDRIPLNHFLTQPDQLPDAGKIAPL